MINLLSISDWIAIAGLIITIILYQRVRKKKIIFLSKHHYKLNNVDFSGYPNLKMTFHDEEINDYLFYVSGTMILAGDSDVDSAEINHPPSIIINDENGKWKSQQILKKSDFLSCSLSVQDPILKIETEGLKSREYIKISGFYQAKTQGIKFRHRILGVSNKIEVIAEGSIKGNTVLAIVLTFFICFFLYALINMNTKRKIETEKEKINYTQTVNLKKPTKADSIIGKRYQYDDLYFIHNDSLKYDSIFKFNTTLNDRLNKKLHTKLNKAIDSMYRDKTDQQSALDKFFLKRKFSEDSLYYVDTQFLYGATDSIFSSEIKKVKKISPNKKFKINDTISISFVLSDYYNDEKKKEQDKLLSFKNVASLIYSLIIIILIFTNFHIIYNLYLLKKYRKYLSTN